MSFNDPLGKNRRKQIHKITMGCNPVTYLFSKEFWSCRKVYIALIQYLNLNTRFLYNPVKLPSTPFLSPTFP